MKQKNIHQVPLGLWRKFGEPGRVAYNNIMDCCSQANVNPEGHRLSISEWDRITHNIATIAAFEVKNSLKTFK